MNGEVKLYSERLFLRRWQESDSERLFELAKDEEVGKRCGWMPHKNVEESVFVIKTILDVDETYAVCLKDSVEVIGCVSLKIGVASGLNLPNEEAELGYWFGKAYWGKGYASEAARAVIERAFKELKLNRLWCRHFDGNNASGRVAEKCGFKFVRTDLNYYWELLDLHTDIHVRELTAQAYFANEK